MRPIKPSTPISRSQAFASVQRLVRMHAFFAAPANAFQWMASQFRMGMQTMAQGMRAFASAQRMQPRAVICTDIAFAPVRTAPGGLMNRKGDFVF